MHFIAAKILINGGHSGNFFIGHHEKVCPMSLLLVHLFLLLPLIIGSLLFQHVVPQLELINRRAVIINIHKFHVLTGRSRIIQIGL